MSWLAAPDGTRITRTKEIVPATCDIVGVCRSSDGTFDIDFSGETDLNYDGQETVEKDGQRVFIDEGDEEWTEDQLVLMERYDVHLIARDIQVTAERDFSQAQRYALADAGDFKLGWNVHLGSVHKLEPTEAVDDHMEEPDVEIEVELQRQEGDLWTFEADYTVTCDASSEEDAIAKSVAWIKATLVMEDGDGVPSAPEL